VYSKKAGNSGCSCGRGICLLSSDALSAMAETHGILPAPGLWGTGPHQKPNRYVAVTTVLEDGKKVDVYETPFGVRSLRFDANEGFF
jgi:beta-galactosidase